MDILAHCAEAMADCGKVPWRVMSDSSRATYLRMAEVAATVLREHDAGAVEAITARIENLPTFKRADSASELPAVDRSAVLSIVRFHLGGQ